MGKTNMKKHNKTVRYCHYEPFHHAQFELDLTFFCSKFNRKGENKQPTPFCVLEILKTSWIFFLKITQFFFLTVSMLSDDITRCSTQQRLFLTSIITRYKKVHQWKPVKKVMVNHWIDVSFLETLNNLLKAKAKDWMMLRLFGYGNLLNLLLIHK